MKATEILKKEHQVILKVLDCLAAAADHAERTKELDIETFQKAIDFARGFADGSHHAKEEDHLFPVLGINNVSCPPGTQHILLTEHQEGREYVRAMAEQLEAYEKGNKDAIDRLCLLARRFIEHLRMHIRKEDSCLFPAADARLSADDQENLLKAFEEVAQRENKASIQQKYLTIADDLCKKWNVQPPSQTACNCCCGH